MENNLKNKTGLASFSLYNIAFTVSNIDNSIKWYQDIFGFKLINRTTFAIPSGSAEAAILEAAGMRIELLNIPNPERIEALFADAPLHLIPLGNKSIVLQVEDLAVATKELEEKGVNFAWKEQYLAGDKMLSTMITDVDGNKINIFQTNTLVENK